MRQESLEERKLLYVQSVIEEYKPSERTWWEHPPPVYHTTSDYASACQKIINKDEPVIFKKSKKEWVMAAVMIIVGALLLYFIGNKEFSFMHALVLILLLLVVVPGLQDGIASIRVSRDGLWFYNEEREIYWENVLLTYIRELREESYSYIFIVHFYDARHDKFDRIEINLKGLASPAYLSACIETFRST